MSESGQSETSKHVRVRLAPHLARRRAASGVSRSTTGLRTRSWRHRRLAPHLARAASGVSRPWTGEHTVELDDDRYTVIFALRTDDGVISPVDAKTVWHGILEETLKGEDLKKLGAGD
jgi:hypothetical protein